MGYHNTWSIDRKDTGGSRLNLEGGESGDSVERRLIYCQSRDTDDNEGPQALNQSSAPEGKEQQGAIKECTPVAL